MKRTIELYNIVGILFLILSACSLSDKKNTDFKPDNNDIIKTYLKCVENNDIIIEKLNFDHFNLYYISDTFTFYIEVVDEEKNYYVYDIFEKTSRAKCGRFVFNETDFSDDIAIFFECNSISLPKEICDEWFRFIKV